MISTNGLIHLNWSTIAGGAAARRSPAGGSAFMGMLRAATSKPAPAATAGALVQSSGNASHNAAPSPASPAAATAATRNTAGLVSATAAASVAAPQSDAAPTGSQDFSLPASFSRPAVEAHMNMWWMGLLQQQNARNQSYYDNALDGWKNTVQRNRELGLPEPPPPPPPELVEVAPKPPGFWFETA